MKSEPAGEVGFTWGGDDYVLRFGMGAIRAFELATGLSIFDAFDHIEAVQAGRERVRLTVLGDLICAGLAHYHPDVEPETAMEMAVDPAVNAALIEGYSDSMPRAKGGAGSPPKPAGRKRAGTGTRSSSGGAKRGKK